MTPKKFISQMAETLQDSSDGFICLRKKEILKMITISDIENNPSIMKFFKIKNPSMEDEAQYYYEFVEILITKLENLSVQEKKSLLETLIREQFREIEDSYYKENLSNISKDFDKNLNISLLKSSLKSLANQEFKIDNFIDSENIDYLINIFFKDRTSINNAVFGSESFDLVKNIVLTKKV